jgi:hypothetical protein
VLEIPETAVPDFPEANCDRGVDEFLAPRGLRYEEYPITDPAPSGYHFILGTSPRGSQHCVVGLNGKLAHDPHPQDGTGRGLVEPKSWGVLEPMGRARDDKFDNLAAEYVRRHNAASKEYKAAFKSVGARMWPMDNAHEEKPHNQQAIAESMRNSKGRSWRPSLPRPLTVLDSYKDVTRKQREWLNKEVDRIRTKYAQDHMTVSPVDGGLRYGDGGFKQWAAKRNGVAKDALSGKRLNAAAERMYEKHDDIDDNLERQEWMRMSGPAVSAYAATHSDIVKLVAEAESLLAKAKLDDDHSYWQSKLQLAKSALRKAELLAKQGDYGLALATQEGAFTLAHAVIDKMRNSGRTRGRDTVENFCECESESHGHKAAGCKNNKGLRQYDVGGYKQTLCPNCSLQAAKYGRENKVPVTFAKDTTRRARLHRALDKILSSQK